MNFDFNDEQKALQQLARRVAKEKVAPRAAGLLTSVEMEVVFVVGPRAPATKQTRFGSAAMTCSAARRAHSAPAFDNS